MKRSSSLQRSSDAEFFSSFNRLLRLSFCRTLLLMFDSTEVAEEHFCVSPLSLPFPGSQSGRLLLPLRAAHCEPIYCNELTQQLGWSRLPIAVCCADTLPPLFFLQCRSPSPKVGVCGIPYGISCRPGHPARSLLSDAIPARKSLLVHSESRTPCKMIGKGSAWSAGP